MDTVLAALPVFRPEKVLLGVCLLIAEILAVVRLTLLCLSFDESHGDDSQNDRNDTTSENHDAHDKDVAHVLKAILNGIHILEYLFLAHGMWKLLEKKDYDKGACKLLKTTLEYMWEHKRISTFVSMSLTVFLFTSVAHPVLEIVHHHHIPIKVAYHVFTIISHLVTVTIRIVFACAVAVVCVIWFKLDITEEIPQAITLALDDTNISVDGRKAARIHFTTYQDYQQRAKRVIPLLRIFDEWFVIQWIHYLLVAIADFWFIFQPHLQGHKDPETDVHLASLYLRAIYVLLAFIIPYLCGMKVHRFHVRYYRKLLNKMDEVTTGIKSESTKVKKDKDQKEANDVEKGRKKGQLVVNARAESEDKSMMQFTYVNMVHIRRKEKCDFIPRIRLVGLSIPISNPGYILGVLLVIFALVGKVFSS